MTDLFDTESPVQQLKDAIEEIRVDAGLGHSSASDYDVGVICDQLMLQSKPGSVWYFGVRECGVDSGYGQCQSIFAQRPTTTFYGVVRVTVTSVSECEITATVEQLSVREARTQGANCTVERSDAYLQVWQVHSLITDLFSVRSEFVQLLPSGEFFAVMGPGQVVLIVECEDLNYQSQENIDYLSRLSGRGHKIYRFSSAGDSGTFFHKPSSATPAALKRMLVKRSAAMAKKMAARTAA